MIVDLETIEGLLIPSLKKWLIRELSFRESGFLSKGDGKALLGRWATCGSGIGGESRALLQGRPRSLPTDGHLLGEDSPFIARCEHKQMVVLRDSRVYIRGEESR